MGASAARGKLNAADGKHIEEAFRAKLLSFAIHHAEGLPESKNATQRPQHDRRTQRETKVGRAVANSG